MKMGQTVENPTYELDLGEGVEGVEVNIDGNEANLVETSVTAGIGSDTEGQPLDEAKAEDKPAVQAEQKDGEELKEYSESVKKRIDKLTSKLREAERREQAAIEFAQGVQQKFLTAEQSAARANQDRLGEAKSRIETQMMTIKQIIKKAREEGDIDTETEAQERLMSLMHEQREVGQYLERAPQQSVQQPPAQPQQFQQAQQFQQPVQQAARPDSKAEEWAEQNPWFGQDYAMTYAAWGIDKQLREAEGFDGSSDEYYDELNRRIRGQFPQKFSAQTNRAPKQNVQAVAPAARSSGVNNSARRSVKLSPSQVAIAKKLGVPVEEYAKYVKE
jgi:hypothetical protein